jgi:long-chain acyl-CoA synthetase
MGSINTILARMRRNGEAPAIFWEGKETSYSALFEMIDAWQNRLEENGIGRGTVCGFLGDYSPQTCALFFALMQAGAILVPFSRNVEAEIQTYLDIAGVECLFRFDVQDHWTMTRFENVPQADLVVSFRARRSAGMIIFTSGSTGKPKAILHDCERYMQKFVEERPGWRTVLFLIMDHIGGINTCIATFAYGGVGLCISERSPEQVCALIEQGRATQLPTSATFLNLMIASGSYKKYDLSSIKLITYGTEVMPETTLKKVHTIMPNARLKQVYGISELGVLRSKSENDTSVWLKMGRDSSEIKIVDGNLWVRSESNMVGYLNAPNPFDGEGWFNTGDRVEVNGEYMRILGRQSELINVGGEKVYPVEVENILLQAENIKNAAVYGVRHPLMGQVVQARVSLYQPEEAGALNERLRKFCLEHMARYKMPVRFVIVSDEEQRSDRFKKIRRVED